LIPAELLLLVERAAPATPGSPFESLSAKLATAPAPTLISAAKSPTAPLSAKSAGPAGAEPEPGTEDWFASLAAVIGGRFPIKPPPDTVLADELERVLLNRPEHGANGATAQAAANDGNDVLTSAPSVASEPVATISKPEPVRVLEPKSADVVLAQAIAARAAASTPATAPVEAQAATAPAPEPSPAMAAAPATEAPAAPPLASIAPAELASAPGADDSTALMLAAVNAQTATVSTAIPPKASRRELAERAWKLHELGNSLASIQGALESSGGTPDDISVIMAKLIALEQARQERFRRTLRRGLTAAALIIFVLLIIAIVLGSLRP
jgi:hypothetical protein